MRLSHLRPVFESPGPFATAYVRTDRSVPTAVRDIRVRARHVAERLSEQGAPSQAGAALERAIVDTADGAPAERVIVWADGRIVFDAPLPEGTDDEVISWEPLPRLLRYVRAYANRVPHVVAVVDRIGGDLTAVDALGQVREVESVDGETLHLRKVKVGDWAHLRYLHHVEEHWKANAKEVAATVDRLVEEVAAERLVVAGDVRAREKLHDKLSVRSQALLTEIDHGGRGGKDAGVDEEAFDHAVHEQLAQTARALAEQRCAMFTERLGKAGAAAEGMADVVAAAAQAQLDTLLLGENFDENAQVWIGSAGPQLALTRDSLQTLGAQTALPAPVGSALLRAAAATDAEALMVPDGAVTLRDGVGALLRYAT
jgi:hypothetical protein